MKMDTSSATRMNNDDVSKNRTRASISPWGVLVIVCTLTAFVSGTALSPTQPYERLATNGAGSTSTVVVAMPKGIVLFRTASSSSSSIVLGLLPARDPVSPSTLSSRDIHRDWSFVTDASQCDPIQRAQQKIECLDHVIQLMEQNEQDSARQNRLLKDGLMLSLGLLSCLVAVALLLTVRNHSLRQKAEQLDSLISHLRSYRLPTTPINGVEDDLYFTRGFNVL